MDCESQHTILDHLWTLREGQERLENDVRDIRFRVGQIEQTLAHHSTTLAHHGSRFDRIDERLGHIETRLGLVDA